MSQIRCLICEKTFDSDQSDTMPFCSDRCRNIDLNRWLCEDYGLPYESEDELPREEDEELSR